ncbi:MAG: hypothetical protein L0216_13425 [Planctomycetales bacterium]|nr:hypothetical protein [Planctomycetales bacterium]
MAATGLMGLVALSGAPPGTSAQDDLPDVPSRDLRVGADPAKKKEGNPKQRYFLVGPREKGKAPKEGYGLLVVMPGGDGSAEFHPFVKRVYKNVLCEKPFADRYLLAEPVAVMWTEEQQIVWPTEKSKVEKQEFSTEAFVEAVIADVRRTQKLDASRIFTLTWSSSGPAAYAISLQERKSVTGSYISMSVFKPDWLPSLKNAAGHAYYIEHSPDDRVCPFRMAEEARDKLKKHGAKVEFSTYEGGHGWQGDVYGRMRRAVEWLEKNRPGAAVGR